MGPRKFWRENLPRLKYHNPAVPMVVNRTFDQEGPATLRIYLRDGGASSRPAAAQRDDAKTEPQTQTQTPESTATETETETAAAAAAPAADPWEHLTSRTDGEAKAPAPALGERVVTIDVKTKPSEDILRRLLEVTGARPQEPTEEDRVEMERLAQMAEQSAKDRVVQKAFRDKIKVEKQMLEKARKEADALKAE